MSHEEEDLRGGINSVVRIGATVRRPMHPWSSAVHGLLQYLESVGFVGAPRFLDIDEQGREVLSLLPGVTPWPPGAELADVRVLDSVAGLLRQYHETVEGWTPTTNTWQLPPVATGAAEVICHNDVAPWNILVHTKMTTALVDWDTAAPGPRMWELAYLAYTFSPIAPPADLPIMGWPESTSTFERLTRIGAAYGCSAGQWVELLNTIPRRIEAAYETMRNWAADDRPGWKTQWEQAEPWRHGAGF